MINQMKSFLQHVAVSNIYLYAFVRRIAGQIPFLLPHDAAFYAFKKLGDGGRIFLDIGANDGISARSYRKLVPNRPILSFEPNPHHEVSLLRVKKSISNFNYELMGAGETNDSMTLFTPIYKNIPLTNYASLDTDAARKNLDRHMNIKNIGQKVTFSKNEVLVKKLDDLSLDPEIIKIDVEGFEDIVISGLMKTIAKSRPMLMVEHNQRSFASIKAMLISLDFSVCAYDTKTNTFIKFDDDEPDLNVFFLPNPSEYFKG